MPPMPLPSRSLQASLATLVFACSNGGPADARLDASSAPGPIEVSGVKPAQVSVVSASASSVNLPAQAPQTFRPSPRPTTEEWAATSVVAEAGPGPARCTAQTIREWLRFACTKDPEFLWLNGALGLGKKDIEHFSTSAFDGGTLEVQLRPGQYAAAEARLVSPRFIFRGLWPSEAVTPRAIIEYGRGTVLEPLDLSEPLSVVPVTGESLPEAPPRADWWDAPRVNTAGSARAKNCEIRVFRGWIRARCAGSPLGFSGITGFGARGTDFETHEYNGPGIVELLARIRRGQKASAVTYVTSSATRLTVAWPAEAAAPSELSLKDGL